MHDLLMAGVLGGGCWERCQFINAGTLSIQNRTRKTNRERELTSPFGTIVPTCPREKFSSPSRSKTPIKWFLNYGVLIERKVDTLDHTQRTRKLRSWSNQGKKRSVASRNLLRSLYCHWPPPRKPAPSEKKAQRTICIRHMSKPTNEGRMDGRWWPWIALWSASLTFWRAYDTHG